MKHAIVNRFFFLVTGWHICYLRAMYAVAPGEFRKTRTFIKIESIPFVIRAHASSLAHAIFQLRYMCMFFDAM